MPITNEETVIPEAIVKIDFVYTDDVYTLSDALHIPMLEYANLTPCEIECMQKVRFDKYVAIMTAPDVDYG